MRKSPLSENIFISFKIILNAKEIVTALVTMLNMEIFCQEIFCFKEDFFMSFVKLKKLRKKNKEKENFCQKEFV